MEKLAQLKINNTPIPAPSGIPVGGLRPQGEMILTAFVNLFFVAAAVLAIIFLILGGIRWIISSGDPKQVEAARKQITYAIVGLIIVFLAYVIVNVVGSFFDVKLLGP